MTATDKIICCFDYVNASMNESTKDRIRERRQLSAEVSY